jgi:mono/diheme cytochrome c family protein
MRGFMIAAAALAAVHVVPANAQQGGALPPGEGRDIVAVACTQCHAPSAFAQLRQGAEAWRHQVYDMILRGAQIHPAEVEPTVGYLTANFGPGINLPPSRPVSLPDGPGKALVEQHCGVCHGLDRVAMSKRSPAEWDMVLRRMRFLGATASADEQKTMAAYLGDKFGAK